MYKSLSDLDRNGYGEYGIEWEFEDGGRWWEWFETEEHREVALQNYKQQCEEEENG